MELTEYEAERQNRVKQIKAKMADMGLNEESRIFHNSIVGERSRTRRERSKRRSSAAGISDFTAAPKSLRRSRRVQGQQAPTYDEKAIENVDPYFREMQPRGAPETYTMEHVKALSRSRREWTLFVDGYDPSGNRIYDKANGQTCHQCRQKTMGLRTSCSRCESLQGVFCGDCLYMRYGEHIEDVSEDPTWTCPNCRDICNCSFHRTRRGWPPTGTLYRKAIAEGYPSVAHYLVLTNLDCSVREEAMTYLPSELASLVQTRLELDENIPANTASSGPARDAFAKGREANSDIATSS